MYAQYSTRVKFDELADPLDRWELVERVGEGTYGEVHLATDKNTGKAPSKISKLKEDLRCIVLKLLVSNATLTLWRIFLRI